MRIFDKIPEGHVCPICGTNEGPQVVLIPIDGTKEGYTSEAIPTHLSCILHNIRYSKEHQLMGVEANKGTNIP